MRREIIKNLDVIAVVIASIIGIILFHLGILSEIYIISLILFLLSIHALHQAVRDERAYKRIAYIESNIKESEVEIIKPKDLISKGEEFALRNRGEMWWFNTPVGFRHRELFDKLLKPAIENPKTTKISFILRPQFREIWEKEALPKIMECKGSEKVESPMWRNIRESIAFKMIDLQKDKDVKEAQLTFLGEPFIMERETHKEVGERIYHPRYLLHIKSNSELIPQLKELFIKYRLKKEQQ